MPKYLLSMHTVEGETGAPMTERQMQHYWKEIQALNEQMRSAGAWVFGGALSEPGAAKVVRMSGSEALATDGPFAESKEHIGGFYIIEAPDLDDALSWASKATAAVGKPIEVRQFRDAET